MCFRATRSMLCEPAMAAVARSWTEEQLAQMYAGLGGAGHDAALVVSELVTNCQQAGAHVVDLTLLGHHGALRVEVTDDAPGWPEMSAHVELDQVRGRGLRIVDAVTVAWGARADRAGKTVWADLAVPGHALSRFGCTHSRVAS